MMYSKKANAVFYLGIKTVIIDYYFSY